MWTQRRKPASPLAPLRPAPPRPAPPRPALRPASASLRPWSWQEYYEYYAPDFTMHYPTSSTMENLNTRQYLDAVKQTVFENMRMLQGAPSVGMDQIPDLLPDTKPPAADPDARGINSGAAQHGAEFYDGE